MSTLTSAPSPRTRSRHPVQTALRRGSEFRRWRTRVGDLLETTAVGLLLAVVIQFLLDGGSHDLTSGAAGGRLVAIGRLTGLVAVDLLLAQLLLAARVPWIDRVYGLDRALKAHRILGRITVPLVLVHVGTIIVGYALRAGGTGIGAILGQGLTMVFGGDDLLKAAISTGLLVVIAVTSVNLARRKMSYEWWHVVHLAAYAAVLLSLPHQLSLGSDFTKSAWGRFYWTTLYVGVAAAVAWWRFMVPVWRSLRHGLRVTDVVEEAPGTWSVWMRGRQLDALPVRAGQYLNWRFLTPRLFLAAHPWSLSTAPDGRSLRITVRDLGDHSRELLALRPGTPVVFEGPYGAFTTRVRSRRRVLLVAAGIGITPVRALLEELVRGRQAHPGDVTLVYRANTTADLALRAELEQLASRGGHRLLLLVGPPVEGSWLPSGVGPVEELVPHLRDHEAYVCGPGVWMTLVHRDLRQCGIPQRHIHDERFSW